MDEKVKNDAKKVMLVQDEQGGKPRAVSNVDKNGNAQTVDATEANMSSLLNVNTQDSGLEAFWKKMLEQANDPAHTGLGDKLTGIFLMTEEMLESLIKIDFNPEELEKYRVDPAFELETLQTAIEGRAQDQLPEQTPIDTEYVDVTDQRQLGESSGEEVTQSRFQPFDVEKIDREDLASKGIKWEDMEPHLKAMSYGHKSHRMVEMSPELEPGGERVLTQGRISLEEQQDGSLKVVPHYWQEKLDLDSPIGHTMLDDTVKNNLAITGHAQQKVMIEFEPGVQTPCYLTVDPLTNTVEPCPVDAFGKTERIKGVDLTPGQQIDFDEGRKITIEKMTTRAGYYKDAHVQRNASDRNFQFSYDGLDSNRYAQENKEVYRQKMAASTAQGETKDQLFIPKRMGGVEVPDWAQKQWREANTDPSKRANVPACYMKDMSLDKQGEPISRWIRPNWEKGKFDFFQWKPKQAQGVEVAPASESKTQAAVNNEGKTEEKTKHVQEPMKQEQQAPKEGQPKSGQSQGADGAGEGSVGIYSTGPVSGETLNHQKDGVLGNKDDKAAQKEAKGQDVPKEGQSQDGQQAKQYQSVPRQYKTPPAKTNTPPAPKQGGGQKM